MASLHTLSQKAIKKQLTFTPTCWARVWRKLEDGSMRETLSEEWITMRVLVGEKMQTFKHPNAHWIGGVRVCSRGMKVEEERSNCDNTPEDLDRTKT